MSFFLLLNEKLRNNIESVLPEKKYQLENLRSTGLIKNWKMQHRNNTGLGFFFVKIGTTEARSKFESQSKLVRKMLSQKKKQFIK